MHRIPYNIPCNTLFTCTIQDDGNSSKRSMADMELELKAMKGDNQKWKDMCHAMQAKLIEVHMGEEEEEDEERVIEDRMMEYSCGDEEFTEEELRMVMRIEEEVERVSAAASAVTASATATALASATATGSKSKSSSTVTSSVIKGSNKESDGVKEEVMEQEQEKEKEKEKKVTLMKDRKRPKDIKENPPSRGKNLTSKDKASSKKTKQKPKK